MNLDKHNLELGKFLSELGMGDELEPVLAYVLGRCTSSPSLDLEALTDGVIALQAEAYPNARDALRGRRLPELLRSAWTTAIRIKDAKVTPDFGIDIDCMKNKDQIIETANGLSACLYCFLRGLKEGIGPSPVLLDNFTLKQLEQLEGAWDLLAHLVQRVKDHPREGEYRMELKTVVRSCFSVWSASFPGLAQSVMK